MIIPEKPFGPWPNAGDPIPYVPQDYPWKNGYPGMPAGPIVLPSQEQQKQIDDLMKAIKPADQKGIKFDTDKPKWSLVPPGVMTQVVEVMTYGAKKYSPDNWMHVDPKRYYDALHRHVDAWRNGQDLDEETKKHHLAHAACCILFMLWHAQNPQNPSK